MAARSRSRTMASAVATVLGAGLVLSTSASNVLARPVVVLEQVEAAPLGTAASSVGATLGSNPSVSGDGQFVVYQGTPQQPPLPEELEGNVEPVEAPVDPRGSTIYLSSRVDNSTIELSPIPNGLRPGNSVRPVISGDGCSVVMISEMALDVFRDDDAGARWDVYRSVLPHCDGAIGNWELVSARADGSSLARDDVDPNQTPAVSRSGAEIAYVHPDERLFEAPNVTTITVVDLAVPPTDPRRSEVVAGTPRDRPNTTFVHTGIDQPALSDDGRQVAYRSDAASAEGVPVWGTGPADGGVATKQVFVWNRLEADPFAAVQLVSALPSGQPSTAGAAEPALSRDGSVVAFSSPDQGLVPAVFPLCVDDCPSQIYRLDRDVDADDDFDEPGATALQIVSVEPGSAGSSAPVVGSGASTQPTLSADGHVLAFVSKAPNLQLLEAPGSGEVGDGDILVADEGQSDLRRITVAVDGVRPTTGAHSHPQLSDSGRITVFDTLAASDLLVEGAPAGRQVVALSSPPRLSLPDADVGTTVVGLESTGWFVGLVNEGPSAFDPAIVTIDDARFTIDAENSTCVIGTLVPAGSDCKVQFTFTPTSEAAVNATLTIAEEGFEAVSVSSRLGGGGGEPALQLYPGGADIPGEILVGESAPEFLFDVGNIALVPTSIERVEIEGAHAGDFAVTSSNCVDRPLNPRANCAIGVTFTPTDSGRRTALLEVFTPEGQSSSVIIAGDAVFEPVLATFGSEVLAGEPFLLAGSDYPAGTPLVITYADGQGQPIEIDMVTNEDGDFFVSVPVDPNEFGGDRQIVVQSSEGVGAVAQVDVVAEADQHIGLPGFGLG